MLVSVLGHLLSMVFVVPGHLLSILISGGFMMFMMLDDFGDAGCWHYGRNDAVNVGLGTVNV